MMRKQFEARLDAEVTHDWLEMFAHRFLGYTEMERDLDRRFAAKHAIENLLLTVG